MLSAYQARDSHARRRRRCRSQDQAREAHRGERGTRTRPLLRQGCQVLQRVVAAISQQQAWRRWLLGKERRGGGRRLQHGGIPTHRRAAGEGRGDAGAQVRRRQRCGGVVLRTCDFPHLKMQHCTSQQPIRAAFPLELQSPELHSPWSLRCTRCKAQITRRPRPGASRSR
jgi:hypothetical protein